MNFHHFENMECYTLNAAASKKKKKQLTEFYKLNMIAVYYRESPYKSAVTGRRQDFDNITSNHITTRSH
jgi:hypothetical protein